MNWLRASGATANVATAYMDITGKVIVNATKERQCLREAIRCANLALCAKCQLNMTLAIIDRVAFALFVSN
jgi:hypothetical protein